jgi:tetratricopeptide (TPR) repeat protein
MDVELANELEARSDRLRQKGDALHHRDPAKARGVYEDSLHALDAALDALGVVPPDSQPWSGASFTSEVTPKQLADLLGKRGGLLRRLERVKEALITYRAGAYVEQGSKLTTTYNRANAIKLALLTGESTLTDEDEHLRELREVLEEQLRSNEEAADDAWLWADLGDCLLLLGDVDGGERAYQIFVSKAETRSPITTLAVLLEVASALKGHGDPQASRVSEGISRVAATFSS